MSNNLQLLVGLFGALFVCGISLGEESPGNKSFWIPTSTEASTGTPNVSTLPYLRTLSSSQTRNVVIERATPLESARDSTINELRPYVLEGDRLLSEKRWLDAKKYFEKTLRQYPDDRTLQLKIAEARRRYEIETRYQDGIFSSLTQKSALVDQLAIFDEVFLDIDVYHVDRPQYSILFEFGVRGIAEALNEDSFYPRNNVSIELKSTAQELFASLREVAESWTLETEDDVRRSVLWMAKQLRRRIGFPESAIISEFLCSTVCSLDAYSSSLTPVQVEDVFALIDGRFVGLGVELKNDQPTKIVRVIPNSPAQECGIDVGDELVKIDGHPTKKLTGTEIGELLQGLEGEKIVLLLRSPNGSIREVTATRRRVDAPSVEDVHILDAPGNIGYVKISSFQKTTSDELQEALATLAKGDVQSLIVDLRQNPGGLLQEAINVSDIFLNSGTIVQTQGRNGSRIFIAHKNRLCELPLTLIVDSGSASAAEIFAGAIQENGRGVIVGVPSYGKGTVQAIVQLTGKTKNEKPIAGLRLTTEKFYSPKGRPYGGVGVLPNVDVSVLQNAEPVRANSNQAYADQSMSESFEWTNDDQRDRPNTKRREVARPTNEVESDAFLCLAVQEANKQLLQKRKR